jgi:hypothetical protein
MRQVMVLAVLVCACTPGGAREQAAKQEPTRPPQPYAGASEQVLRAGFAEADITPGREEYLAGYGFRASGNDGANDPLMARVLVVGDGDLPGVFVSLDLCLVGTSRSRQLREYIAKATNTSAERVIVAATHTHSGPWPHDDYLNAVAPKIANAARRACRLMFPVRAHVLAAPLGMAYNRRVQQEDGSVRHCWGPQEWPDRAPENAPDPTCTVLLLRQVNGPRKFVLWNFGAHPVVLGKTSRVVSADYPGAANRLIEQYLPNSRAIFALGPCGNTQPWIATQEDPGRIEPVARCAASFVSLQCEAARPLADEIPTLQSAGATLPLGDVEADVTVWRLGGVWIVTVPVELFQELGLRLREALPGPELIVTCANGAEGYLGHEAAFNEGGYEIGGAGRRGLKPGDGEKFIDAVVEVARPLMQDDE